ncbi:MAG: ribosome assembly RNA-binding protein YhbY [Clostridiaceae bacterium]|jgi:RNA-binding protein|nr:ribosome assembly RNA-binding protein YhbY [Clostridiaceae bacterium]
MLTSKQRSYLRGLANTIEPIFQIGKGGVSDNLIKQFNDALESRELIKATVLKNSEAGAREIGDEIAQIVGADVVQVIGNKFVLYRESEKHKEITSALSVIR